MSHSFAARVAGLGAGFYAKNSKTLKRVTFSRKLAWLGKCDRGREATPGFKTLAPRHTRPDKAAS